MSGDDPRSTELVEQAGRLLADLEETVRDLEAIDPKSARRVMVDVAGFATDWWGNR